MADPHVKHEPVGLAEGGQRLDAEPNTVDHWCEDGRGPYRL
jgi:hypothetical protein